jgi:hypothetical protein
MFHTYLVMWKYNCEPLWSSHGLLCDNDQITTRTHDSMINTHGHFKFTLFKLKVSKFVWSGVKKIIKDRHFIRK